MTTATHKVAEILRPWPCNDATETPEERLVREVEAHQRIAAEAKVERSRVLDLMRYLEAQSGRPRKPGRYPTRRTSISAELAELRHRLDDCNNVILAMADREDPARNRALPSGVRKGRGESYYAHAQRSRGDIAVTVSGKRRSTPEMAAEDLEDVKRQASAMLQDRLRQAEKRA